MVNSENGENKDENQSLPHFYGVSVCAGACIMLFGVGPDLVSIYTVL